MRWRRLLARAFALQASACLAFPAAVGAASVTLAWDAVQSTSQVRYLLHVGTSAGVYLDAIPVGGATQWTVSDLVDGVRYVFAVQAFDRGAYSPLSNEVSAPAASASPASNRQGLWWNAPPGSESGWGISLAHQADTLFATWFTYDFAGRARWLSMTAQKAGFDTYRGTLFETRGPGPDVVPFDPHRVVRTPVGTGTFAFGGPDGGTFTYTLDGIYQTKDIVRQAFGPVPVCTFAGLADPALATNYQDLWWNAPAGSESGWGVSLAHQGDVLFGTWFTYDASDDPAWLSVSASKIAPRVYRGDLVLTTGPAFDTPSFNPALVQREVVGTASFTFGNGNDATFDYSLRPPGRSGTVDGSKTITRQIFALPGTTCE